VLFWSRATRDRLESFGWGIAALHRFDAATKLPFLAARPTASIGTPAGAGVYDRTKERLTQDAAELELAPAEQKCS
jgi:hypothetical protein